MNAFDSCNFVGILSKTLYGFPIFQNCLPQSIISFEQRSNETKKG